MAGVKGRSGRRSLHREATFEDLRAKINGEKIINQLNSFVVGKIKMDSTQVTASIALLKKILPDLQAVEHSGEVGHHYVAKLPEKSHSVDDWVNQVTEQARKPNGSNGTTH